MPKKINLKSDLKHLVLGYYDLERFYLLLSAHKNPALLPITFLHELQHQRLNTTTTYGQLITKVVKALKSCRNEEILRNLEFLLDRLIENCTTVHEMQATYISLLEYNQKQLFNQLPIGYQDCFNLMESTLVNVPALLHETILYFTLIGFVQMFEIVV